MSDTTSPAPLSSSKAPEGHLDNLSKLHRMSRTAGLGSTDYAAVNVAAVMTAVLGVASFLAVVSPIFLIIPVVGVVIGIIAIRQVHGSSGTQTGMTLAILGLIACGLFSGFTGYKTYAKDQERKADEAALVSLVDQFGQAVAKEDYAAAYQLLDARFRDRVPATQFEKFFVERMKPYTGAIKGFKSSGLFIIDQAADDAGIRMAQGSTMVSVEKTAEIRLDVTYRLAAGKWQIFNLGEWFPAQQGPGGPGGSGGPGAPGGPPQPQMDPTQPMGPAA